MSLLMTVFEREAEHFTSDRSGKFNLTLSSNTHGRPLENVVISIQLGSDATSVSATASGDNRGILPGGGKNPNYPVGALGGGTWDFDPNKGVLRWMIGALTANEKAASLVGSFVCR